MCIHLKKKDTHTIYELHLSVASDQNKYICTSTLKIEKCTQETSYEGYIAVFSLYSFLIFISFKYKNGQVESGANNFLYSLSAH